LGCGSGFQSIALADLGFQVTAIDLSQRLLRELAERKGERAIVPLQGDICDILRLVDAPVNVVICMGDTLPHLESKDNVIGLLRDIYQLLVPDGHCLLSFRDLSNETAFASPPHLPLALQKLSAFSLKLSFLSLEKTPPSRYPWLRGSVVEEFFC